MDVRSKTATRYNLGWSSPPTFILITDQGEFPAQSIPNILEVPKGVWTVGNDPFRIIAPFKGAKGTPKALRIIGFISLNSRGLPARNDISQEMTFYFDQ